MSFGKTMHLLCKCTMNVNFFVIGQPYKKWHTNKADPRTLLKCDAPYHGHLKKFYKLSANQGVRI